MASPILNRTLLILVPVALSGILLSAISAVFLLQYTREQNQIRIERHLEVRAEQLQLGLNHTLQTLTALAGLFTANDEVSRSGFESFVGINLDRQDSIVAMAWVPIISHAERETFEQQQLGGHPIFDINSHGLNNVAFRHNEYYPVKYLYSRLDTRLTLGLNLGSHLKTQKRLARAAEEHSLLVTEGIRLSMGAPGVITVRAYLPVYRQDNSDLKGFVMAQIDVSKLMIDSFGNEQEFAIVLLDTDSILRTQRLYLNPLAEQWYPRLDSVDKLKALDQAFWSRQYVAGDRNWLVAFLEHPEDTDQALWLPFAGLAMGLLFTSFLCLYMLIASKRSRELALMREESEAKSRFLQAIGHDLRQPLNVIGLHLDHLEQDVGVILNNGCGNKIEQIRDRLGAMHAMFTSLLDITRLDAGMTRPQIEMVQLQPLLTDLGDEFDLVCAEKSIDMRVRCPAIRLRTDRMLLERVLRNLLGNAVKFTDSGRILLAARQVGTDTHIYIYDTGRGFDTHHIDDILKPFHRGKQSRDVDGLGLGLAIVSQTIELLGIDMQIHSQPDIGTRIVLTCG